MYWNFQQYALRSGGVFVLSQKSEVFARRRNFSEERHFGLWLEILAEIFNGVW